MKRGIIKLQACISRSSSPATDVDFAPGFLPYFRVSQHICFVNTAYKFPRAKTIRAALRTADHRSYGPRLLVLCDCP